MRETDAHTDRLTELTLRYLDQALDAAEERELRELLRSSDAAGERFVELCIDCRALAEPLRGRSEGAGSQVPATPADTNARRMLLAAGALAAAAVIVFGVTLATVYLNTGGAAPEDAPEAAPIGVLVGDDGARWTTEHVAVGSTMRAQALELSGGRITVDFHSGVTVGLAGPVRFTPTDPMRGRLASGTLVARAPEGAEGFTIDGPGFAVVDLGTEFGVHVNDDGTAAVCVFDGTVELRLDDGRVVRLSAGESRRIDGHGALAALEPAQMWERFGGLTSATGYEMMIRASGPAGYWPLREPMDEARDDTQAFDAPAFDAPGPHGDDSLAARFDGKSAVDLGARPELLMPESFTVETWAWIDPASSVHGRLISFDLDQRGGWGIGYSAGDTPGMPRGIRFTLLAVKDFDFAQADVPLGRWVHLAAVVDRAADEVRLYVDGEPAQALAGVPAMRAPAAPRVHIAQQSPGYLNFKGRVCDLAVYDRVLSGNEIRQHARNGDGL